MASIEERIYELEFNVAAITAERDALLLNLVELQAVVDKMKSISRICSECFDDAAVDIQNQKGIK